MGNKEMVETLIKHGARLKRPDNNDEIPLFIAIRSTNAEVIDTLLRGFDITTTNRKRQSALHLACMAGSTEISRKLIDCRVDMNGRDVKGNTPMHYATMCDCEEIVNTLLSHGADPTIRNAKGKSPFFYASVNVAKIFRQYFQGGTLDNLTSAAKKQSNIKNLTPPLPSPKIVSHKRQSKNRTQPLTPQKRHTMQYEYSENSEIRMNSTEDIEADRTRNSPIKKNRQQPPAHIQNSQEYISKADFEKYRTEVRQELDDLMKKMNQIMYDFKREIIESQVAYLPTQDNK